MKRTNNNESEQEILNKFNKDHHSKKAELIAYAQHEGRPTRGLDFTSDYNIALFFACRENDNEDGCLWIVTYMPHQVTWITSLTINLIATMNEDFLFCYELANKLKDNDEYWSLYSKRSHDFETEFICSDITSYLHSGFMVIYDYESEKTNMKIKKQKGSLFYCGSKYYDSKNKECSEIDNSTLSSPYYKIGLHKINNPSWLQEFCIKLKIPSNLKSKIMEYINITGNDLGLE